MVFNYTYSQQNLVPNPSFESYTACPSTLDQLNYSVGWASYRGSPDFYNTCSTALGIPSNGLGYQPAATGNAYAGFIAYDINGFVREIIGAQLSQTLSVGQLYYVSLKVSLAEFDAVNKEYVPCNKVGIKFSTTQFHGSDAPYPGPDPAPINNLANFYTINIISDTSDWTILSGTFISDSNYKYVMIGNFFDDSHTDTISRFNGVKSYFYVDDICVSTNSFACIPVTGITNTTPADEISIYPNPANATLSIKASQNDLYTISICNSFGEILVNETLSNKSIIDVSGFPEGFYFATIQNSLFKTIKKITINHQN